jgi:hypothetical protein
MPSRYINAAYIRIHIMDVVNRTQLSTMPTGLAIVQIYGSQQQNYTNNSKFEKKMS